jgi:RNA polymerase sigma-70 factor (ECF subfamily)
VHGTKEELIDHLFREHGKQMIATLTRFLGVEHLELAENAVSESLLKALKTWSFNGLPENPRAWLYTVAKNYALDQLRRKSVEIKKVEQIADGLDSVYELATDDPYIAPILIDDRLKMIFLCAHPLLKPEEQVALSLKLALGLSVKEISKSFAIPVKTLEQRLVRAKKKLRQEKVSFELPGKDKIKERVSCVHTSLYLLFNEGYCATEGEGLTSKKLCRDAIELLSIVQVSEDFSSPAGDALLSLFYFQASRLEARVDDREEIVLLEDQDRTKWNREYIQFAQHLLNKSATGEELSRYHCEAEIASLHAMAASVEETDWKRIAGIFEFLFEQGGNPIYKVNRAVALIMNNKVNEALEDLLAVSGNKVFKNYHYYYCALSEAYSKLGEHEKAKKFLSLGIDKCQNKLEKQHLERKLDLLNRY